MAKLNLGEFFKGQIVDERTFASGKRGYGAYGKSVVDGKPVQVSCNIVVIEAKK